jgi:prepilin-type N-terminal cleavage/methylation domain-containing protein
MKTRPESCCNTCCRQAFTLVEVVASLMLLGTLLVGVLVAHRRHVAQIRTATRRLEAVTAADELMESWRTKGVWGPESASGQFPNRGDLVWQWSVSTPPELRRVQAAVGRLEVYGADQQEGRPLASVEILTNTTAVPATGPR